VGAAKGALGPIHNGTDAIIGTGPISGPVGHRFHGSGAGAFSDYCLRAAWRSRQHRVAPASRAQAGARLTLTPGLGAAPRHPKRPARPMLCPMRCLRPGTFLSRPRTAMRISNGYDEAEP
jgi:hypothetical protein